MVKVCVFPEYDKHEHICADSSSLFGEECDIGAEIFNEAE